MRYVKSLDGIRGLAVLLVVLFHYGYVLFGWIGVQLFFTLSGYLITSILLDDKARPFPAYMGRFYWRRSLRIFPLFFAFLAVAGVTYALWGRPRTFRTDWHYLLTYTANFARIRSIDLGGSFGHLWSLAVEEQFYLLWPLLAYFLPTKQFKWVVVAFLLASPLIRFAMFEIIFGASHDAAYAGRLVYVLPFTQFDAFAAGAAIPLFALHDLKHAGRKFLMAVGALGVTGFAVLVVNHLWHGGAFFKSLGYAMYLIGNYQYVWGYSLLNLASALAIICALQGLAPTRVLAHRSLVWMGKVSYGVYLYHVPLLMILHWALLKLGVASVSPLGRFGLFVIYVGAVLALSWASFRWLESPFLALKDYWEKRARKNGGQPNPSAS